MADSKTSAQTNVHLHDAASITMTEYATCEAGPFVSVQLGQVASLLVHEVSVLDALAVQVVAARDALADMLAGQDLPPEEETTLVIGRPWMGADQ